MNQRKPGYAVLGYAADILGPMAAYWIIVKLGIPAVWGLACGAAVVVITAGVNTVRRGRLDSVGALVLVELAASIVLLSRLRSPRMLLIRPSFYTGISAVWLMGSAFTDKPLSLEGSRPFATKGDPVRTVAWERAWRELPQFRLAHRALTFGLGLAFAADAGLRVLVVFRFPLDRAAWLSSLPHLATTAILLICGALFGRWAGPLVDKIQREMEEERPSTAISGA